MQILLVEDDAEVARFVKKGLQEAGHIVEHVANGRDGLFMAASEPFDLLILDRMLPGGVDGLRIVETLRSQGNKTPVLFLTALGAVDERVKGLKAGGDDYLVKPFAAPELVARLKALVRRSNPRPVHLQMGGLQLDPFTRRAMVDGQVIELSAREWAVLEHLMQNSSRVVSKQQIIDAILPWGEEVTLNAVEVYVSRIRAKIDSAGISIKTIRGFGYLLEQSSG